MDLREPNVERLLAAYRGQALDRVPHFDYADPANVRAVMGWGPERPEVLRNDMLAPSEQVEFSRRTSMDVIIINLQYWFNTAIEGWDDLDRIVPPDTAAARQLVQSGLDAVAGTGLGVMVMVTGPLFVSYYQTKPIPIQSFMYLLYDDLALVEKMMDLHVEHQLALIEAVEDLPISVFELADDIAVDSGFIIPPAFISRLWEPRIERVIEAIQRTHSPIQFHCCGRLDEIIPMFVKWGIEAVTPIQANCNDIYALKRKWCEQICLVGNIDINGVLSFGTPDEVVANVRKHLAELAPGGGYVLGSSHSIVDSIPPENFQAMVDATVKYGQYSPAGSLISV